MTSHRSSRRRAISWDAPSIRSAREARIQRPVTREAYGFMACLRRRYTFQFQTSPGGTNPSWTENQQQDSASTTGHFYDQEWSLRRRIGAGPPREAAPHPAKSSPWAGDENTTQAHRRNLHRLCIGAARKRYWPDSIAAENCPGWPLQGISWQRQAILLTRNGCRSGESTGSS